MPSIQELEAQLEEAKKAERAAERAHNTRINELRKRFRETQPYIYTVSTDDPNPFMFGHNYIDVDIEETVYISRKIDPVKYDNFRRNLAFEERNFLTQDDLEENAGMRYYITFDGIIHHTGGGTVILKTPQLCSNAEWAWLKAGNIPVKFLRSI